MAKKRGYTPKPWESMYGKPDIYAPMHKTMLLSAAYKDLRSTSKVMLQFCIMQKMENQTYPKAFSIPSDTSREDKKRYFVMNQHKWKTEYGITTSSTTFNECMEELIMHGFVDCVFQGKMSKVKNVYRLSERWQQYENDDYVVPPKYMTAQMLRDRSTP